MHFCIIYGYLQKCILKCSCMQYIEKKYIVGLNVNLLNLNNR